jgi:hypothetical protein
MQSVRDIAGDIVAREGGMSMIPTIPAGPRNTA